MAKIYFYLKLNPPRASFMADMNDEEKAIMFKHVEYWKPYVADGTVLVLGPVMDSRGGYGMAVVGVDDEHHLQKLIQADPANGLNTYEYHPMRAVSKWITP